MFTKSKKQWFIEKQTLVKGALSQVDLTGSDSWFINPFTITERNKNQWFLSMNLWHSHNIKVILLNFAKAHYFSTLWTVNCVDCAPFSCVDYFHTAHIQTKQFKKILFSNFWKTQSNCHLRGRGPIKSVSFVRPSACLLSVCGTFFSASTRWIHNMDVLVNILKSGHSEFLKNITCCLDNWVNETNVD